MNRDGSDPQQRERPRRRSLVPWIVGIAALVIAVAIAAQGIRARIKTESKLQEEANDRRIINVSVITAQLGPTTQQLVLPGNVTSYYEAPIYARTSGYLKAWHVDIGSRVKRDQLLAEIDTPEVDDQLRQAQADMATAEANNRLAQSTAKRW